MLVSLNWLKNYVDYGALTPEELGELITKSGIEVDGIHHVAAEKSEQVVVGYVQSCEPHPNADRLSLCQVDVGDEVLQIVCGAPNVQAGQKVAVAKPGAVLPGNFKIKKVKLRGVESNGMICSLAELGVDEAFIPADMAEGIYVFPEDVEVGESVEALLNLNDAILDFDLTPNRADCLSMLGVAYEVSAILDVPLNLPDVSVTTIDEKTSDYTTVAVEDPKLTPYYGAFIIKDVEIKPSPLWMRNYLMAAGIRPINNVVDITNYVLIEYGQPLHAFDYDRVGTKEILVRNAKENETIVTLDGQERTLKAEDLVITNGEEPIALAGVMGGANSEVTDETKTILLEAALFDPFTIRKTAQRLGLRSEASNRFEKGIDPSRVKEAGMRACQLLQKYANGKVLMDPAIVDHIDRQEKIVTMNTMVINNRLGTNISTDEIKDILRRLQFNFEVDQDDFSVSIPTRRGDITIFEDMVEEVARIYGYDNLPYTLPENASRPGGFTKEQSLKRAIKQYLQSVGLTEAITYSLTSEELVSKLISPDIQSEDVQPIALPMPMSEDHKFLRLSILPELLKTLAYNRARKELDIAYYEWGSVFLSSETSLSKQPKENVRLAGALTGTWTEHKWRQEKVTVDFYIVKGIVEGLFQFLNLPVVFKQATINDLHPGRCATLHVHDQLVGFIGQLHPMVAKQMDLGDTFVFDLNMETILALHEDKLAYKQIPRYPSVVRDVAFVVDQDIQANDIKMSIETSGIPYVTEVDIFDVYTGEHLPENKKSLAYSIHFQDPEQTLTDEVVDDAFEKIVELISNTYNATIRS